MVRRPVLGIEEADLENAVNWSEPHSLGKICPNLRVPPLYESKDMVWRVHGERAGQERSDGGINRPLLDIPPTRGSARHANKEN